jgi:hypothetical protein
MARLGQPILTSPVPTGDNLAVCKLGPDRMIQKEWLAGSYAGEIPEEPQPGSVSDGEQGPGGDTLEVVEALAGSLTSL